MNSRSRHLFAALAAVVACAVSACSSTASSSPTTAPAAATTTTVRGAATPTLTEAASLRADLTRLMTASAHLTSMATSAAATGSDPAPVLAVVNENSHELATRFSAPYTTAVADRFNALWSEQAPLYVAYAHAKVANDIAAGDKAKTALNDFRAQFETFLVTTNNYLLIGSTTTPALEPTLGDFNSAMLAMIDAQVEKPPTQYAKLTAATADTPLVATLLAAAVSKKFHEDYPGNAIGTASNLRSTMTAAFVESSYLLGITTASALRGGNVAAAKASLAANTRTLANAIGATYGDVTGNDFSALWSEHIDRFLAYAAAAGTGDRVGQSRELAALGELGTNFADLLASPNPHLAHAEAVANFNSHVSSTIAVIDAQAAEAAKPSSQFDRQRNAGTQMSATAALLSEAIALQFPKKYLA